MNHWYDFQGVAENRRHMCHEAVAQHNMHSGRSTPGSMIWKRFQGSKNGHRLLFNLERAEDWQLTDPDELMSAKVYFAPDSD